MSIVLTRIDSRLIHGQVLEAWVPHIHANCIVVANDTVAAAGFQKSLMMAAVPRGIKVIIGTLAEVAALFSSRDLDSLRVLLLFASSEDALRGHRLGIPFEALNLGNMHGGEGKVRLSCTIALDGSDIANLTNLEVRGPKIVSQCVPSDREQDWRKLIQHMGQ